MTELLLFIYILYQKHAGRAINNIGIMWEKCNNVTEKLRMSCYNKSAAEELPHRKKKVEETEQKQ